MSHNPTPRAETPTQTVTGTGMPGPAGAEVASASASARPRSGLVVLVAAAVLLAGIGGLAALALRGNIEVPAPLVARLEAGLGRVLDGRAEVELGGVELSLTEAGRPRMVLRDLALRDLYSADSVSLPAFEVTLARRALLRAELRPETVRLDGARLRLSRDDDGLLSLALHSGGTLTQVPSLPALIAEFEAVFDRPGWQALRTVTLADLTLEVTDARLGEVMTLTGGEAVFEVGATAFALNLSVDLPGTQGAGGALRLTTRKGVPETDLDLRLDAVPASLLAAQAPVLGPLAAYDGAVSGRMSGRLAIDGSVAALAGSVRLAAGQVVPGGGLEPVDLDEASATWSYVAGRPRIRVDALSVRSARLRLAGTGYLEAVPVTAPGLPDLLVQADLSDIWIDARPATTAPLSVARVLAEGRWSGAARRFDLAQVLIQDEPGGADSPDRATSPVGEGGPQAATLRGRGVLHLPGRGAASARLDLTSDRVSARRVLAFWPAIGRSVRAGDWLRRNVADGVLENATARLSWQAGQRPEFAASFDVDGARLRIVPSFPDLQAARGHGALYDHRFTIRASSGRMDTGEAGAVALAGTSFQVPDTRIRGADARLGLAATGSVAAAFALLDEPPIGLGDRLRLPVDRLSGAVNARGTLNVPMRKGGKVDLETLDLEVELTDLVFADLAPGMDLVAEALGLRLAGGALSLTGSGVLQGVPLELALARPLTGPPGDGTRVTGRATLGAEGLARLGVVLPPGLLTGTAEAQFALILGPGSPPRLELRSDLLGAGLAIPELGWSKPPGQAGALVVDLRLGPAPQVESLTLEAPGLTAEGRITLRPAGAAGGAGMDRMELTRLVVGSWLDAQAVLTGRGPGVPPGVSVTGGRLDLRSLPRAGPGRGGARAAPLEVRLDRVEVNDGIALTEVRGSLRSAGALEGSLTGRVNGASPVRVQLSATEAGRQRIRVVSDDAGAVLASAGILRTLRGGTLDLSLTARADRPILDGALRIEDTILVETPTAVQVLSAISIVGLLDQMATGGLGFTEIATGLSLSPEGITLRAGRANGPALGITFEGVVMPRADRMDLQGVVSPLYLLNGIGGALLARRGEGLLGVSYRLSGGPSAPEVSVNPLTLLTPGVFRDLFRRAPPDLTQ